MATLKHLTPYGDVVQIKHGRISQNHLGTAIRDVQVIGVPDEKYGEEVLACVILRNSMEVTAN